MIRGYEVYGRTPGIHTSREQEQPPEPQECKIRKMTPEEIAKYGEPTNKITNRVRTFEHLKKEKKTK